MLYAPNGKRRSDARSHRSARIVGGAGAAKRHWVWRSGLAGDRARSVSDGGADGEFAGGLGYASTIDPTSGADSTVLLTIAQLTAGLLFFASGADRLLVKALAESLRLCSARIVHGEPSLGGAADPVCGAIFSSGLRLAAAVDRAAAAGGRLARGAGPDAAAASPDQSDDAGEAGARRCWLLSATVVLQPGFFESLMTAVGAAGRRQLLRA